MTKILITGATGTIGSQTVTTLLERGAEVRVAVRNPAKAAELASAGAEVVRFDFLAPETFAGALEGVERVMLLTAFTEQFDEDLRPFVAALTEAEVGFVLRISASGASPDAAALLGRRHAAAEDLVKQSGAAWTVLQPTFFMDNFINFAGASIRSEGAFYGASNNQPVSYVSTRDIAEVAATVLLAPEAHASQTYVLTGPEALRDEQVAAQIGSVLEREVRYVDLTPEQIEAAVASQGAPSWRAEAMGALESIKRQGWAQAVSPAVAEVLGRSGESFTDFLARRGSQLAG